MSHELDLTRLLVRWRRGDEDARARLFTALYGELEHLAHVRLAGERPDHTLETGALVHEAYIGLVDLERIEWRDRAHFLAMASRTMRRVLVDHARRHKALKRGGDRRKVPLEEARMMSDAQAETLLELDDVLNRLQSEHSRQARAIELYYLGGLTQEEVAVALDVSQPTVARDLEFGRAWLAHAWRGDLEAWRRTPPPERTTSDRGREDGDE